MQQEFSFAQKGLILNKDFNHLLVLKYLSSKFQAEKLVGNLALPGGRVEFGEEPDTSFRREIKEETGLNIAPSDSIYMWMWTYEKPKKECQIIASARVGIEKSGILKTQPNVEGETSISAPFWLSLDEIIYSDFVEDEIPAVKELMRRLEDKRSFKEKIRGVIN